MNALDLFCGACGGWSLGLERAGFRTIAACEIDPWRQERYLRNFPGVKMYGDIRDVSAARLRADGIGPIDLVCGSPPCQDASTANTKGKGVDGERTGLFFEFVRVVRELRPCWVAAENVPGIRTRGIDRVLAALEREGYAVWPLVVGAVHCGAPHKRNRVWVVARNRGAGGNIRRWEPQPPKSPHSWTSTDTDAAPMLGAQIEGREPDRNTECVATKPDQTGPSGRQAEPGLGEAPQPINLRGILARWRHWNGGAPEIGRMDDGLPKGMARPALAAYGDSIVPQIAEAIGRAILQAEAQA